MDETGMDVPDLETAGEEENEEQEATKRKKKKPKRTSHASNRSSDPEGGFGNDDDLLELLDEVVMEQESPLHSSDEEEEQEHEELSGELSSCRDSEEEEESDGAWKEDDVSVVSEDALERRYLVGSDSFTRLVDPGLQNAYDLINDGEPLAPRLCKGLKGEQNNYKKICEELGVTPSDQFLSNLHNDVMDLSYMGLNQKGVEAVCRSLKDNESVKTLLLRGNDCSGEAGEAIAQMLETNFTISHLNLARTKISRSLKRICEALRTNVTIEVLDLSRNDLTDAPLKFLAPVLSDQQGETLHGLRELYLSRNYIQDEGLLYLNKGFADNSTLEVLDLGFNRLLGEADSLPFYLAAAQHKSLRRLDLQWNSIQDTAGSAIAKIMVGKKSKLEYLNVSSNLLTAATCAEFGKCFAGSKTTTTLIAGPNKWNVGPLTQGYLANMMAPLLKAKAPAAELLDLCYITPVHSQFIKTRETLLRKRPNLQVVHGEPFGFNEGTRPDMETLIIRRAKDICEDFETPLEMLIDELRIEPPTLTPKKFKKFIKSCNLYKDKKMTKEFINNFRVQGGTDVDCKRIIAAYDKEYPRKIKIKPVEEVSEEEQLELERMSELIRDMEAMKW